MMKLMKNMVAIVISMNIILSSMGIYLFVHTCNAAGTTEFSLYFVDSDNENDSFDCQFCSSSDQECSCKIEESSQMDCCSEEKKTNHNTISLEPGECCIEYTKFLKLDVESIIIPDIKINIDTITIFVLNKDISLLKDSPVKPLEFLTHYSGISPPYESNFIYFISSLLE